MSKIWALGVDLADVIGMATPGPATSIRRQDELGSLAAGPRPSLGAAHRRGPGGAVRWPRDDHRRAPLWCPSAACGAAWIDGSRAEAPGPRVTDGAATRRSPTGLQKCPRVPLASGLPRCGPAGAGRRGAARARLAVARLDGWPRIVVVVTDRCPHRSTRLSVGTVDGDCLRCAYHGWPSAPTGTASRSPRCPTGRSRRARSSASTPCGYGLVWVRLDDSVDTALPALPRPRPTRR